MVILDPKIINEYFAAVYRRAWDHILIWKRSCLVIILILLSHYFLVINFPNVKDRETCIMISSPTKQSSYLKFRKFVSCNKKLLYLVSSVHKHILFKWIIILKNSKTKYINFTDVRPFPAKRASTDNNYQLPLLAKGLTSVKFM